MRIALLALWIMALAAPMPVMSQGRQGGNRQNHTERPARQPSWGTSYSATATPAAWPPSCAIS